MKKIVPQKTEDGVIRKTEVITCDGGCKKELSEFTDTIVVEQTALAVVHPPAEGETIGPDAYFHDSNEPRGRVRYSCVPCLRKRADITPVEKENLTAEIARRQQDLKAKQAAVN